VRAMPHALRPLPAAALLVVASIAGIAAAEEPAHPRAAVVIHAADGVDPFVEAYLFEVAATVLRSGGYRVAPPNATSDQLRHAGQRARSCADDDACVRAVAAALSSPTLVFVDVSAAEERQVAVVLSTVVVRSNGVQRSEPAEARGSETEMAERVQRAAADLATQEPPCHVEIAPEGGLALRIRVGDSPAVAASSPLFVSAGTHEIQISAAGRSAWTGTFTCQAGRRYRIRAR